MAIFEWALRTFCNAAWWAKTRRDVGSMPTGLISHVVPQCRFNSGPRSLNEVTE